MKLDQITGQINKGQSAIDNSVNTAKNAVNRVQSTVENAERGIQNTVDKVSQLSDRAGETFNKLISGGSELTSKIGNLFGGSDIASVGVPKQQVAPPPVFLQDKKFLGLLLTLKRHCLFSTRRSVMCQNLSKRLMRKGLKH